MWWRSSDVTVFFLPLIVGVLFAVAACLLTGFSVLGALTFLAGIGTAFLVVATFVFLSGVVAVFLVMTLLAGVATTTFFATDFLAEVVLAAGFVVDFSLLVAMAIPFKVISLYNYCC